MIHVEICTLAGELLELEVPLQSTVLSLKQSIAKQWSWPVESQQLVLDKEVLTDTMVLESWATKQAEAHSLSLTLVVTLDCLYESLRSARASARLAALGRLAEVAPKGCRRTVSEVVALLDDSDPSLRREAVQVLLKLAGRGNEVVIAAVQTRLSSRQPALRIAALLALPRVLNDHDERRRCRALREVLDDPDAEVRRIALHAMNLWLDPEQAKNLQEENAAIIVDARSTDDFTVSHVREAWSLPWSPGAVEEERIGPVLDTASQNLESTVIVYSDTGAETSRCGNVARALYRSPRLEPHRVYRLSGGLNAWKERGFPVEGDARSMFAGRALLR